MRKTGFHYANIVEDQRLARCRTPRSTPQKPGNPVEATGGSRSRRQLNNPSDRMIPPNFALPARAGRPLALSLISCSARPQPLPFRYHMAALQTLRELTGKRVSEPTRSAVSTLPARETWNSQPRTRTHFQLTCRCATLR